jgi:hypothetical protein
MVFSLSLFFSILAWRFIEPFLLVLQSAKLTACNSRVDELDKAYKEARRVLVLKTKVLTCVTGQVSVFFTSF